MKYIQPNLELKSFTCPHCNTVAMQSWWHSDWNGSSTMDRPLRVGACHNCEKSTVRVNGNLTYPDYGNSPFPN